MMQSIEINHHITPENIELFIANEKMKNASDHKIRRLKNATYNLYEYVQDHVLTKEVLWSWRNELENKGYASATVLNYVKYVNYYLRFIRRDDLCFKRGKAKDITNMKFGYLTAIEPTNQKYRGEIIWKCKCKCGKETLLPVPRLLSGNTLSCGCLKKEVLKRNKKYYDGTSLVQSMDEKVKSKNAKSGYTGVVLKRNKWQAYITYKGKRYSLGCYFDLQDAIDARRKAKDLIRKDVEGLLDFYAEMEKTFSVLPIKEKTTLKQTSKNVIHRSYTAIAKRNDNKSGHTGVHYKRDHWEASISFRKVRYHLGKFDSFEDALKAREKAECLIDKDSDAFIKQYK